ncbi:hypothetical protein DPM19_30875 [Actinomadura craniellae]|uniref:non-specific serine/threonine protein kinase n=1 Tax=Actinomadura craniellae TaxID=2231787 RepID=A0A365GX69_9ACTN|nr:serine/threonine-protein kinase [Actinomadura craniellae]RAY11424.1 hypothetical protein DPM19_30875 [Actinomadura craniellae]
MREHEPLRPGDPRSLGEYRLIGWLGEGTRGVVYRGVAPGGDPVAVRLPRLRPETHGSLAAGLGDVRMVAVPRVARLLSAGIDAGRPYIAGEFVDGPSLAVVVALQGPRPRAELHRLAGDMAEALAAIHRAGVVHGDLDPGNVLLHAGRARLVDFGIAPVLDALSPSPSPPDPAYLAPERFAGGPPSTAADIFAWAATVVYAACGRPPFGTGLAPDVAARALRDQPDTGGLDDPLRALVLECLAKNPRDRPPAADLLHRLAPPGEPPVPLPAPLPAPVPPVAAVDLAISDDPALGVRFEPAPKTRAPVPAPAGRSWDAPSHHSVRAWGLAPADVEQAGPVLFAPIPRPPVAAPTSPHPVAAPASPPSVAVPVFPQPVAMPAPPEAPTPAVAPEVGPENDVRVAGRVRHAPVQESLTPEAFVNVDGSGNVQARIAANGSNGNAPVAERTPARSTRDDDEPDEPDEVDFSRAATGLRRRAARTRRNAIVAGAVMLCFAVPVVVTVLRSSGGSAEQFPGEPAGPGLPVTGPAVEAAASGVPTYRLAAVGGGGDGGSDAMGQPTPPVGTVYAYAEYVLTNLQQREVPLEYPADIFVTRGLVPAWDQNRCLTQPGVPIDVCVLPAQNRVVKALNGTGAPEPRGGEFFLAPGASYLVRVATEVPVSKGLTPRDMKLYVWEKAFIADQLPKPMPFPG